ncbi:MAG: hypothetical protein ACRBB5_01670 [Nitrosopumilus sp.]
MSTIVNDSVEKVSIADAVFTGKGGDLIVVNNVESVLNIASKKSFLKPSNHFLLSH